MRILVIDDDPYIGMLVSTLLAGPQLEVSIVATGADGLARLTDAPPDLVLLDVGLPDVSGFEILRILRSAPGWLNTRILMLTASHEVEHIVRAKDGGAAGYICKPVQPDALADMVLDMLTNDDLVWLDDYTRSRRPT